MYWFMIRKTLSLFINFTLAAMSGANNSSIRNLDIQEAHFVSVTIYNGKIRAKHNAKGLMLYN